MHVHVRTLALCVSVTVLGLAGGLWAAGRPAILGGQSPSIEDEIRRLEQLEIRAIMARDKDILRTLWDEAYIVNNPDNRIVEAGSDPTDRPVMQKARTAMTRTTEKITVRGDVAFAMGGETIVPGDGQPRAGQTVNRRYTNVWMKQRDGWKLVARHANVMCS